MSEAFWAFGSILQLGDGASPEVFTSVAEITKLQALNLTRKSIDLTHHQSPSGYEESIPGLRSGGEYDVEANWLPNNATHDETTGILESFNDNLNHNWKIVLPDSIATIAYTGHVNEFKADLPLEAQGKLSFKIKVSGKPTLT